MPLHGGLVKWIEQGWGFSGSASMHKKKPPPPRQGRRGQVLWSEELNLRFGTPPPAPVPPLKGRAGGAGRPGADFPSIAMPTVDGASGAVGSDRCFGWDGGTGLRYCFYATRKQFLSWILKNISNGPAMVLCGPRQGFAPRPVEGACWRRSGFRHRWTCRGVMPGGPVRPDGIDIRIRR